MSAPEPHTPTPDTVEVFPTHAGQLVPTPPTAGLTRTDRVVRWIGFHAPEAVAVTVPTLVALTVSGWAWIGTVLALVWWAVSEHRAHRDNRTGGDR